MAQCNAAQNLFHVHKPSDIIMSRRPSAVLFPVTSGSCFFNCAECQGGSFTKTFV